MHFEIEQDAYEVILNALTMQQTGQATNVRNNLALQAEDQTFEGEMNLQAYVVDMNGEATHHPLGKSLTIEAGGILYIETATGTTIAAYAPGAWRMIDMREETADEPVTDGS